MSVRDIVLAAAGNAGAEPLYVEDVFSTYLYNGTGATTQNIVNGIDLAGEGGLIWLKSRSSSASYYDHVFCDTVRGRTKYLASSGILATAGEQVGFGPPYDISSFNSNGFSLGDDTTFYKNVSGQTFASWTFRKAKKFFDIVTYTGGSSGGAGYAHSLGSAPGMVICKAISETSQWAIWHRGDGTNNQRFFSLNSSGAAATPADFSALFTATTFNPFYVRGIDATSSDLNGVQYVAYLFAHDAGGFGDLGTDSIIKCGVFTTDGSANATVNLGWEPQWVLIKPTSRSDDWKVFDTMRGWANITDGATLLMPNSSAAESVSNYGSVTSTGFTFSNASNETSIYVAIRRGPMKTPDDATKVFYPTSYASPSLNTTSTVTTGFPVDSIWCGSQDYDGAVKTLVQDRLRIKNNTNTTNTFITSQTSAENSINGYVTFDIASNTGYKLTDSNGSWNGTGGKNSFSWSFRRAPGFFDTVCWTTTQSAGGTTAVTHNLGVAPELVIVKSRSGSGTSWFVRVTGVTSNSQYLSINSANAITTFALWGTPTATTFTVDEYNAIGGSGSTAVAYLFATCPGVSKVGSYTGTANTLSINCGFTSGCRFLLIKRTDAAGAWYVWDTARGLTSSTDPYLTINTADVQVTGTDYVDPYSIGFTLTPDGSSTVNVNGGTYIYLAIA